MEQLRIGVCEDDKKVRDDLCERIASLEMNTVIEVDDSAEKMLKAFYPGKFDLIFMDIYMTGMTGIEALQQIRKVDDHVEVAIMTTSQDFALDAYRLHVMRYIEKPVKTEDVRDVLTIVQRKKEAAPHFEFRDGAQAYRLPFDVITYLEQSGRKVDVFQVGQETPLVFRGKIDDVAAQFPEDTFFRCHKSYLVNLAHVKCIDRELMTFIMQDGKQVHIRRQSFFAAKRAYEAYLFSITEGGFAE